MKDFLSRHYYLRPFLDRDLQIILIVLIVGLTGAKILEYYGL